MQVAGPNANTAPAGVLRDGVLTVALDARPAIWHPNGDSLPGMPLHAFAEEGKQPSVPGPLLRVPQGTEIRARVHNSLPRDTLTLHLPATARGAVSEEPGDSVIVPPGETRELRVRVTAPGNYFYRGTTGAPYSIRAGLRGLLVGALIVDTANAVRLHRDRIFVITLAPDSIASAPAATPGFAVFAINGRAWPHTERIAATVGDTVHWRVINASNDIHPLHLHGFYYRVDALAGTQVAAQGQGAPGRMVVTERMPPFSTMSLTWAPERPGNWLFHCHFQLHLVPDVRAPSGIQLAGDVRPATHEMPDTSNHALTGMAGLVLGINVAERAGAVAVSDPVRARRQLRLVAVRDPGFPDSAPSMRFILEEPRGTIPRLESRAGFSPTISLTRGEPVSIMVVNRLAERTAVHWHGIELESYYDGVAGFSGSGTHLAPTIAPGDSFEARFTPPRSGTFMYHSHVNEVRQHAAGLVGPLIVRDAPGRPEADEAIFFLKGARAGIGGPNPLEINGTLSPDTVVLHAGRPARLRFIGLSIVNPNATVWLTSRPDSSFANLRDTMVVQWRQIAKDGADIPESARTMRLARQIISMGETYDFEIVPRERGNLRIEVRSLGGRGRLLVRVPVRIE
jgi:FtsP/CotA-like multicopper oxidase with cupredoxin domain